MEKIKIKLSLSSGDVIVYTEYSKDLREKLLKLISDFNKVANYKFNIFTKINIMSENIKYLRINPTQNAQDHYEENYRALRTGVLNYLNK